MIKLVLADMDSTLVPNSVAAASERTLAAIDRLRASGIGFGCATGRAIANTISQFRHHPEYVTEGIYGAGKQVLVHGELIRDDPFPPDLMARIAAEIARQITRRRWPIKTTRELYDEVAKALAKVELPPEMKERAGYSTKKQALAREELIKKSSARVFQALRIDINHEYEVLYEFMEKLPQALKSGGRAAILTFHSGEDRIVKKAFKNFCQQGIYREISQEVIRPSKEECYRNSRAHSTKLRWAIKA